MTFRTEAIIQLLFLKKSVYFGTTKVSKCPILSIQIIIEITI